MAGVPRFDNGDRLLLLLYRRADGTYTVIDLQLGSFHLTKDRTGRELAVRNEADIEGWDLDGQVHNEQPRSAAAFLTYVRETARGEAPIADYFVASAPVAAARVTARAAAAAFTASSYTLLYGSGLGTRWNVFPGAVAWNQGNSETGALGSGTPEITSAFSTWNAGGTNYVLTSANANNNGFLDPTDGVNNVVFEKNLTSAGVQPFNCTSGGALGMGGMTRANFGAGAHVYRGETFGTTLEADVSMNQGLAACTKSQVTPDQFKTVILHELGHTLGFRHSDQNRPLTAACATDATLDCSNGAVMNHILLSGLNGVLQQWDNAALSSVYGNAPACVPPSITSQPANASINSGNAAPLFVGAAGTAPLTYQWFIGASGNTTNPLAGGTSASAAVTPSVTTSYWARVTGACGPVANSNTATVTVAVVTCAPPLISSITADQTIVSGNAVSLRVDYVGNAASVTWFRGVKGDTSTPIGNGQSIATAPLTQTSRFWARLTNACGTADTNTITITVPPKITRNRAVTH
jgi:hypothetical protein